MSIIETVNELNDIVEYRRRFYTTVYISSGLFNLSFKLIYVETFKIMEGWLYIYFEDKLDKFYITDDFVLEFKETTPVETQEDKRKRFRRV